MSSSTFNCKKKCWCIRYKSKCFDNIKKIFFYDSAKLDELEQYKSMLLSDFNENIWNNYSYELDCNEPHIEILAQPRKNKKYAGKIHIGNVYYSWRYESTVNKVFAVFYDGKFSISDY